VYYKQSCTEIIPTRGIDKRTYKGKLDCCSSFYVEYKARAPQCFLCNARVDDEYFASTEHALSTKLSFLCTNNFHHNKELEVGYILWELVEDLEFLHLHKIVQRELKGDNVLMAHRHQLHGGTFPS